MIPELATPDCPTADLHRLGGKVSLPQARGESCAATQRQAPGSPKKPCRQKRRSGRRRAPLRAALGSFGRRNPGRTPPRRPSRSCASRSSASRLPSPCGELHTLVHSLLSGLPFAAIRFLFASFFVVLDTFRGRCYACRSAVQRFCPRVEIAGLSSCIHLQCAGKTAQTEKRRSSSGAPQRPKPVTR